MTTLLMDEELETDYLVVGAGVAGKTALDACVWLLERGLPATAIQWIRPRVAWWAKATRLNALSGIALHGDDPSVIDARERIKRFGAAAASNLVKFLEASTAQPRTIRGAK